MRIFQNTEKRKKLLSKTAALLFIGLIFLVLLSGLLNTLFFPDELSEYELRYANKLLSLTAQSYMDGSFQQSMDAALGDQVDLSSSFKKAFNRVSSEIHYMLLRPFLALDGAEKCYYTMNSGWIFGGDCLVAYPYGQEKRAEIDEAVKNYNRLFDAYPDKEFFVYYVEQGLDINFATNEKAGLCDCFFEGLNLPAENMARFAVESIEDYTDSFYRTDHHWKHTGSYCGYLELMELLRCTEEPIRPTGEVTLPGYFRGSSARGDLSCYKEIFSAYTFDYPEMKCTVDGIEESYGAQDYYIYNSLPVKGYGYFYGLDRGEVKFSTGRPERDNILVIGDSYDNAVIKLLASHFNNTYSVDPRNYEVYMYKPLSLDYYIEECEIDKVLILGNFDTLTTREFYFGG